MRDKLRFGAFLAPHHPIEEHPLLMFENNLRVVTHLDQLGYDEFWCGEHHSDGWEPIASPEMFLAAAAERTQRIRLGTGVVSVPYHHPFMTAQRMVQLDWQSRGRAIFGSGPGALPSDAHTLGVDPMDIRDRHDEALGVIKRLLETDERFTHESDWFTLRDAKLQLRPMQDRIEFLVASLFSPSGMTLAGKYETSVMSFATVVTDGLFAMPNQWSFAEESAAKHGNTVDRKNWRVNFRWHIAETRDQAREQARHGILRHLNEYVVDTLSAGDGKRFKTADDAIDFSIAHTADVIGTPEDLVQRIAEVYERSGGFGTVIGFAHDWANRENSLRSWDIVARRVIPEVNGLLEGLRESNRYVIEHREPWKRTFKAVTKKIMENKRAAAMVEDVPLFQTKDSKNQTKDSKKQTKDSQKSSAGRDRVE